VIVPGLSAPIRAGAAPVKTALCDGVLPCALTAALDFENLRPESGETLPGTILLRTGGPAWNPLFPWLNDLEVIFLVASVAGAACGFRKPRTK
jgi:hypothetical protein